MVEILHPLPENQGVTVIAITPAIINEIFLIFLEVPVFAPEVLPGTAPRLTRHIF
jgi:hypothetical protein